MAYERTTTFMDQTICNNSFMFVILFVLSITSINMLPNQVLQSMIHQRWNTQKQIKASHNKQHPSNWQHGADPRQQQHQMQSHCKNTIMMLVLHSISFNCTQVHHNSNQCNLTTMKIELIDTRQLCWAKTDESNQLLNHGCWFERFFCHVLPSDYVWLTVNSEYTDTMRIQHYN